MSPKFSFIKVDLKNAHNIIVRKHQIQEKKYKKYLKEYYLGVNQK